MTNDPTPALMGKIRDKIIEKSFIDGYLEHAGIFGKPRDKYTPEDIKVYQTAVRFSKEYREEINNATT